MALEYEVQRIVSHKKTPRGYVFGVRWVGWKDVTTFEALDNLTNCSEKLGEYLAKTDLQLSKNAVTKQLSIMPKSDRALMPPPSSRGPSAPPIRGPSRSITTSFRESSVVDERHRERSVVHRRPETPKRRGRPPGKMTTRSPVLTGRLGRPQKAQPKKHPRDYPEDADYTPVKIKAAPRPSRRTERENSPEDIVRLENRRSHQERRGSSQESDFDLDRVITTASMRRRPKKPRQDSVPKRIQPVRSTYKHGDEWDQYVVEDPKRLGREDGFTQGWMPDKVVGTAKIDTRPIVYLLKWQDTNVVEPIDGETLRERVPDMLIEYLEDHLVGEHDE